VYDGEKKRKATELLEAKFTEALVNQVAKNSGKLSPDNTVIVLSTLLVNDKHWQVAGVRVRSAFWSDDDAKGIDIIIINSTNESRARSYASILDNYRANGVIGALSRACSKLRSALRQLNDGNVKDDGDFSFEANVRYAQGLQYGNMGCGYACALNQLRLVSGAFDARFVTERDRKTVKVKKKFVVDGETIEFEDDVRAFVYRTSRFFSIIFLRFRSVVCYCPALCSV